MNFLTNEQVKDLRAKSLETFHTLPIPKISHVLSYEDFFRTYLLQNCPCILAPVFTENWRSRKEWCTEDGSPNFDFLQTQFGAITVPVANCKMKQDGSHPKLEMTLDEFVLYWKEYKTREYPDSMDCLYLKDFHFNRAFPDYKAYETPEYFSSDWMNEFWDQRDDVKDDYRFVYMGPKGSWTPFHADVFRSFSWSANICGKKKWIFFPPGEEDCLKDINGHLVFDVNSEELEDSSKYPNYNQLKHRFEVIQSAGEIIFVPSGWHHQVYNLEDTISINHNWLNGCNIDISWEYIKQGLRDVENEIQDFREEMIKDKTWYQHCQKMLKADKGINFPEFFKFMETILLPRIEMLQYLRRTSESAESSHHLQPFDNKFCEVVQKLTTSTHWSKEDCLLFDIQRVKFVLEDMIKTQEFEKYGDEINDTVLRRITKLVAELEQIISKYKQQSSHPGQVKLDSDK